MKVNYKGFEISAKREKALGGWRNLYFYVMRLSDGWFLCDSFTEGSDKVHDFIVALAGELKVDLYVLHLPGPHNDASLPQLLARIPPHSILLIEDIDATFTGREKMTEESGLTFAGFLNALDGAISQDGMLVFMTTNRKDVLDPALIRPGRADVHVEFDYATAGQAARMYRAWFPAAPDEMAVAFGERVAERRMSMAEVQAHLLLHKDSAPGACALRPSAGMPPMQAEPETITV